VLHALTPPTELLLQPTIYCRWPLLADVQWARRTKASRPTPKPKQADNMIKYTDLHFKCVGPLDVTSRATLFLF